MKKLIIWTVLLCCGQIMAQTVSTAEYFFDMDPGVTNGTKIALNSNMGNLSQKLMVPTASLSTGFHSLYIRIMDEDGQWGLYDRSPFYTQRFDNTAVIEKAEYYIDDDPGVGHATSLSMNTNTGTLDQSFTISMSGLTKGFHSIHIRTQDSQGQWSLYDRKSFFIKDFLEMADIVSAEFFIDSDPGIGSGSAITFAEPGSLQSFTAPVLSDLAQGEHIFYVRVRNSEGKWSIYDAQAFTVNGALGLGESILDKVTVYPNPFLGKLLIKSAGLHIEKLTLYDTLGKTVFESKENKQSYELSQLGAGTYILNLKTNRGSASYRLLKK